MTIHSVGAVLFHAERQTDRHDKGNSRFSQFFANALIKREELSNEL